MLETTLTELHREGDNSTGMLRAGDSYLLLRAEEPVESVTIGLNHVDFLENADLLRYGKVPDDQREQALRVLSDEVTRVLRTDQAPLRDELQYDLVANPVELSALPFELARDPAGKPVFAQREPAIVLTRRVRHGYQGKGVAWWVKPRILFAVASPGGDVPVDDHDDALKAALKPWVEPLEGFAQAAPDPRSVFTKLEGASRRSIRQACAEAVEAGRPFTHIHLLAHGCEVGTKYRKKFGVALHSDDNPAVVDAVDAEALAETLSPAFGAVAVVTLAACDSANQTNTIAEGGNIAHTLQTHGVPVVLASQFPLTFPGSSILVRTFYGALLTGDDVREALHAARLALYDGQAATGHDWASVVGYVQLPEDYRDRLAQVSLESQMAALRTAQAWADHLVLHQISQREPYERVASQLRERIENLRALMKAEKRAPSVVIENLGLLGSAQKRLAELCFERGRASGEVDEAAREATEALEGSLADYRKATNLSLSSHWTAVQQLSLEAVLQGAVARPHTWYVALEGATVALEVAQAASAAGDVAWAYGSLAEIYLLAPVAGQEDMIAQAEEALVELKGAVEGGNPFPLESTRRQLRRYVRWWTKANGFFGDRAADLAADADRLLKRIPG